MATKAVAGSILGLVSKTTSFAGSSAHNTVRDADTTTGVNVLSYCYVRHAYTHAVDSYSCIQSVIHFDLSALGVGSVITAAELELTESSTTLVFDSPTGTKSIRMVDAGDTSDTLLGDDYRAMNTSPDKLFDLIPYGAVAGTYAATAAGLVALQTKLDSNRAIKLSGTPESLIEGYNYYNTVPEDRSWRSLRIETPTLNITYIPGDSLALGINF